jgi:uncharacterized protein YndB with AHSA1/START domain
MAQVVKVGTEFLVNTQTAGWQFHAAITDLSNGGFVISWTDESGTLGDESPPSVKAQLFNATGGKVGTEFLVNTQTLNSQGGPTITSLSNGGFVISWSDSGAAQDLSSDLNVKAQVFDAAGGKVGTEFLVNTQTLSTQGPPTITGLSNGGFVISWQDESGTLGDASGFSVKAQVFNATGGKVGTEFLVNTQTVANQSNPTITGLSNGGFVVSWEDHSVTLGDASEYSIKAQVFNAMGGKVGTEFLVNTQTGDYQDHPTITGLSNGGFVISWQDESGTLGDASGSSIKAQVFDAAGGKVGTEFLVNTQTERFQSNPTVTGLSNGGFVVSWDDQSGTLGDASVASIKAQVFDATGGKVGLEFLVNTQTADYQAAPKITGLSNGGFVVSWEDQSRTLGDASGRSVKAQVFNIVQYNTFTGTINADTLVGTNEDDVLLGLGADDALSGLGGNDILNGGPGTDQLDGGLGLDYATYAEATSGVVARLDAPNLNTGEAAGDSYIGVEGLIGSQQTDVLVGDEGGNILYGGGAGDYLYGQGGNDYVVGGSGGDILDGGSGFDFASYETSAGGVFARLDIGSGTFGDAQGDTYSSIEGLIGSSFADILVGNAGANQIYGGDGVDQLTGGAAADLLDGGASFDFARYDLAGSGVVARLDLGVGLNGDAAGDTYVSIEGLVGSEHSDVLVGTSAGNYLFGIGGNDTLYGFGGYDEIYGGAGADTFAFRAVDLPGGFATIRDYSAVEGDGLVFEGVAAGSLEMYQSGADTVIQLAGGAGGVVVANTSLAQLDGHLFFA